MLCHCCSSRSSSSGLRLRSRSPSSRSSIARANDSVACAGKEGTQGPQGENKTAARVNKRRRGGANTSFRRRHHDNHVRTSSSPKAREGGKSSRLRHYNNHVGPTHRSSHSSESARITHRQTTTPVELRRPRSRRNHKKTRACRMRRRVSRRTFSTCCQAYAIAEVEVMTRHLRIGRLLDQNESRTILGLRCRTPPQAEHARARPPGLPVLVAPPWRGCCATTL